MSRFEIVEARLHHCGQMARLMRREQREAIARAGYDPHHELRSRFDSSSVCRALLIDGRLAALGGIVGTLLSPHGSVWVVLAEWASRAHPLTLARIAARQLDRIMQTYTEVASVLVGEDEPAHRLAVSLGFSVGAPILIGNAVCREMRIARPAPCPPQGEGRPFFVIYALPRSRTAWLSAFLSYGGWACLHEQAIFMRSLRDVRRLTARPRTGSVETAAGPAWRLLRHYAPEHRAVVIRRPVEETVEAMMEAGRNAGAAYDEDHLRRAMRYGDRCLTQISDQPGTLTLDYSDLAGEAACQQIFEHCLPYPFDREWWSSLKDRNIQTDLSAFFRHYQETRGEVEVFKRTCRQELTRLVRAGEL